MQLTAQPTDRYELAANVGIGSYSVDVSSNRRREPRSVVASEDDVAKRTTRRKLVSTTRDLRRKFSAVRWAINKHLDFIVPHNFRANTGDAGWDDELEAFVKYASHKSRYDSAQMHGRKRFMRIMEASRIVDGDVFGMKIAGGRTQGIEGDRVQDPNNKKKGERWAHGIRKNRFGAWDRVAIARRSGTRLIPERVVSASKVIPFGYYDRFDQTRGISPVTSAIQEFGDVYDGFDYALAREKVNQFFSMLITRDSPEDWFPDESDGTNTNIDKEKEPYEIDFGKGPVVLDLDPGDDAKFLHAMGTSTQSREFWDAILGIALKSIDIPFSFFREDFTNFFGSRAALLLYLKACKSKRDDVAEYEDTWLRWRLREGEANGEITIPSGFDVENAIDAWEFIPDGMPWWNPVQEVKANIDAVDNYQRCRSEIRQEQWGDDWYDMMRRRKREDDFLISIGMPVTIQASRSTEVFDAEGNWVETK